MRFDVDALDAVRCGRLMTACVVPRPIAWITTRSAAGVANAGAFSFFNAVSSWPPVLAIGMQPRADGRPKDTLHNIREGGEFVVNLVAHGDVAAMNATAQDFAPEVDELARHGIATLPSAMVAPPRIATAPVAFECRRRRILPIGNGRTLVLGQVLCAHVRDEAVTDPDAIRIDAVALDLVARLHGADQYLRVDRPFAVRRH